MAEHSLTLLCSMATRNILADLASRFRERTGREVVVHAMGGVEAAKLVRNGERADLVMLAADALGRLESEGHVLKGSIRPFALSGIAVAVPSGTDRPAIGDAGEVRAAMIKAQRICYSTGPSGDYLAALWRGWGIAEAIEAKSFKAPPGVPVAALLARREADLGFQQLSEMLGQPGIDILGELPPDIQQVTTFSVGLSPTSGAREAAEALLAFLTSGDAEQAKAAQGMRSPR